MKQDNTILASIASLLIMILLYGLSSAGLLGDNPVGQTASYVNPLIVPAGYAFSIWGIIYLGLLVFPFYHLYKGDRTSKDWKSIRILFSFNVILNGVWLAMASYNWLVLSVMVIVIMLITLFQINEQLINIKKEGQPINYWTERLVFIIYFAWVTLATALNVSSALSFYKWAGFGISDIIWSYIILPIVAVIAGLVVKKYRAIPYAAVVVWAFTAIAVKHWGELVGLSYLAAGVAGLFVLWIVFLLSKRELSTS